MLASTLTRGALLVATTLLLLAVPGDALGAKRANPGKAADAARPWLGLGTSASDRIAGGSSARNHLVGHLPPVRENIDVVGKLELSTPPQYRTEANFNPIEAGQIADVAIYKQAAYLNSWSLPVEADGTCNRGGFFSVDISDPAKPRQLAFMPARTDFYHGEGAHVVSFNGRDILAVNNEYCAPDPDPTEPSPGGFELYDVTNPASPVWLTKDADPVAPGDQMPGDYSTETEGDDGNPFMSTEPTPGREFPSSNHSIFLWQDGAKLYAVSVDNVEAHDVDIFDVTNPSRPEFIADLDLVALAEEQGFDLVDNSAFGNSIFHHDMVVKKIGNVQTLLSSYWDSGYVKLNVNDPTAPTFIGDSDFGTVDPLTGQAPPEGNGHQGEFSHDNEFVVAADEDFSTHRPGTFEITTGPNAGEFDSVGVGGAAAAAFLPDLVMNGPTVYGGYGCDASDPIPARGSAGLPALEPGEEAIVVLQRGPSGDPDNPEPACFPGEKAANAIEAGYDAVLFVNHHPGEAGGPFCGSGGEFPADPVVAVCTTHEALHTIFGEPNNTTVPYPPGHGPPLGDLGEKVSADSVFDGWGYVHLFRNTGTDLVPVDDYAIPEALDERYSVGYGDLSVHEWATDPDVNLGYVSYYAGGMRVFRFGDGGLEETGKFIDEGGNDFWGVEAFTTSQGERLFAGSDRDLGLYLFRYTGPGAVQPPAGPAPPGPPALKETGCENVITGTAGRDLLAGTEGSDTVRAAAGDDVVDARSGGDCLFGDLGKDVIDGEGGNDRLEGGTGDDRLLGAVGNDALIGGRGVDRLNGNAGNDRLGGGAKRDILSGGSGRDALVGGTGNDTISGGPGNDRISGGSASDRIYGNAGADRITPGSGRDRVIAAGGNDRISARDGKQDRISCGSGRDRVTADRKDKLTNCERVTRR